MCAVPIASWIVVERHAIHQRQAACEEVANLMDQLTRQPWQELTAQHAQQLRLDQTIDQQLPGAQLVITVQPVQEAKRIRIRLTWRQRSGQLAAPVQLTTWVYPHPPRSAFPRQPETES